MDVFVGVGKNWANQVRAYYFEVVFRWSVRYFATLLPVGGRIASHNTEISPATEKNILFEPRREPKHDSGERAFMCNNTEGGNMLFEAGPVD